MSARVGLTFRYDRGDRLFVLLGGELVAADVLKCLGGNRHRLRCGDGSVRL